MAEKLFTEFPPVTTEQWDAVKHTAKALSCGFQPISLGKSRLRTETAALVAVHTLNLFNQK